jgi:hypothetical protein
MRLYADNELRQCVGVMEDDDESGGSWEPTAWTRYPPEMDLTDPHGYVHASDQFGRSVP